VEVDLSHIKGRDIVYKRDEISAKHLLELILELINILKNEQDESMQGSQMLQEDSINNNEIISKSINTPKDSVYQEDKQYIEAQSCPNINIDHDTTNNKAENEETSNLGLKENYSQNDLTRYEKVLQYIANNEEFQNQQEFEQRGRSENPSYENLQNIFNRQNRNQEYKEDESKSINISHISEVSRSKENSEPHSNNKYAKQSITSTSQAIGNSELRESSNLRPANSNSEHISKSNKYSSQQESYVPSKLSSIDSKQVSEVQQSGYVEKIYLPNKNKHKPIKLESKPSSKAHTKSRVSMTDSQHRSQEEERVLGRAQSQRRLMRKSYSNKSDYSSNTSQYIKGKTPSKSNKSEMELESMGDEIAVDDALKYEIMKEFRRLYGNKLDRLFLKTTVGNSNNSVLEMIMQTIKIARNKMIKMGADNIDPDDLQV
jgi:hypothetical protein